MSTQKLFNVLITALLFGNCLSTVAFGQSTGNIKHVLLISVDGMHAIDFSNCSKGIKEVNGGEEYCPHLASLAHHGVNYLSASSSKPSDSFPGLTALVTAAHHVLPELSTTLVTTVRCRLRRRPLLTALLVELLCVRA